MIFRPGALSGQNEQRGPLSFVAVGDGGDRRAFINTIRALALLKRFGDRLTLVGYGQHRRTLEKWAEALGVEHLVFFGAKNANHISYDFDLDVVILCNSKIEQMGSALSLIGRAVDIIAFNRNCDADFKVDKNDFATLTLAKDRISLAMTMIASRPFKPS